MFKKEVEVTKKFFSKVLPWLPTIVMLIAVIIFLFYFRNIDVDEILSFTPRNIILAIACFFIMYAIETFALVFPIPLLYAAAGVMFDPFIALAVNIIGLIISLTVAYLFGRHVKHSAASHFVKKYPKIEQFATTKNEFFLSFMTRIIAVIPADVISQFLGSIKVDYKKYIAGSFVGAFPSMVAITILGTAITDPKSPEFIWSVTATVLIALVSLLIYRFLDNRKTDNIEQLAQNK